MPADTVEAIIIVVFWLSLRILPKSWTEGLTVGRTVGRRDGDDVEIIILGMWVGVTSWVLILDMTTPLKLEL